MTFKIIKIKNVTLCFINLFYYILFFFFLFSQDLCCYLLYFLFINFNVALQHIYESDMNNIDKKWNLNYNYHILRKKYFHFLKHNSVIMQDAVKFWIEKYSEFNVYHPIKIFKQNFV